MKERIRPPKDLELILDRLKEDGVFETKQKGMMFAASIGYVLHRDELPSAEVTQGGEGIRMEYFRSPDDHGYIDVLAVAHSGNLAVMSPEKHDDRIDLFERCAYLGLKDLKSACYDARPEHPLLGVLTLLDSLERGSGEELPGLTGLF